MSEQPKPSQEPSFVLQFWTDAMAIIKSGTNGWKQASKLKKAYTATLAVFLCGLLPMSYDFYAFVRIVACISLCFFFLAANAESQKHLYWQYIFLALIVLYNPIDPVHFGEREIWVCLNVLSLAAMFKGRQLFDRSH